MVLSTLLEFVTHKIVHEHVVAIVVAHKGCSRTWMLEVVARTYNQRGRKREKGS